MPAGPVALLDCNRIEAMTRTLRIASIGAAALVTASVALAQQQLRVEINRISETGVGEKIGSTVIAEGKGGGITFKVSVTGLSAGKHGFHVHEAGNCGPAMKDGKMTAGIAAGEHYDPDKSGKHEGPAGKGHKGDLPALTATAKGVEQTVAAPRLKMADVLGRALVIHQGGDTYTDQPESGGGGARIACGVIPKS